MEGKYNKEYFEEVGLLLENDEISIEEEGFMLGEDREDNIEDNEAE